MLGALHRGQAIVGDGHRVPHVCQQLSERLRRVLVVVHDQYASRVGAAGRRCLRAKRVDRSCDGRQPHDESAAATEPGAARFDGATMKLDEALAHGKAHAEATVRAMPAAVNLLEQAEHAADERVVDADAIVPHRQRAGAVVAALELDRALTAWIRVLRRIGEQVDDDLFEAHGVAHDGDDIARQRDRDLVTPLFNQGLDRIDRAIDQFAERLRHLLQLELPVRDPRHVEQFVDDANEVLGLPIENVDLA